MRSRPTVVWILPAFLVPLALFALLPWLAATFGGPVVSLIVAATAIFELSYANYLSVRWQRTLDEVQVAGGRFAAQWGMPIGQAAFVLLLMLPPTRDGATALVSRLAGHPGMVVDPGVVVLSMTLGFCGVVMLQAIAMVVLNAIWQTSKS